MSKLNIPESWVETVWENLIDIQGGSQPPKSEFKEKPTKDFIRLLQIRDFTSDDNAVYIPTAKAGKVCTEDDILIGRYGASIGRICTGKAGAYNVALAKVIYSKDSILKSYLEYHLRSPAFQTFITTLGGRAAQAGFNKEDLASLEFPLPPVKEQERVVQKIEACFEKIDATEVNLIKVTTLLEKYRESLLAKSFRGELVPQDPSDESASVLLEKIRKERSQKVKGRKSDQEFAPITDDGKPFDLPASWSWVKLGELITLYSGQHIEEKDYNKDGKGAPYLTGPSDFGESSPIIAKWTTKPKVIAPQNSLLITVKGSGVGKTNLNLLNGVCISRQLMAIEPSNVNLRYLDYFMGHSFNKIAEQAQGLIPGLSRDDITQIVFPLPPFSEQIRIANELTIQINHLTHLNMLLEQKKLSFFKMRESILQKAFEGRLVEQIPSEGTGHELLAKILAEKEKSQKLEPEETKTKKTVNKKAPAKAAKSKGKRHGKK